MKVVALALVVLIVFSSVSIACHNEINNTNNVPMPFTYALETFGYVSDLFEHQIKAFYGTFDYWSNLFSGNFDPEAITKEFKSINSFQSFFDFFKKYDLWFNFWRSVVNLVLLIVYSVIEGLTLVLDLFRLCWGFVVGVPRPVT